PAERLGEANIAHIGLQVLQVVLDREAPRRGLRVELLAELDLTLVAHGLHRGVALGGHPDPEGACEGKRLQPPDGIREVPEPFATEEDGLDCGEGLRADALAACSPDIKVDAERENGLVLRTGEELILQPYREVVEPGYRGTFVRVQNVICAS